MLFLRGPARAIRTGADAPRFVMSRYSVLDVARGTLRTFGYTPGRVLEIDIAPVTQVNRREVFGWAMFDFANQAYTLLIITVIFGDLFTRIIVGDAPDYRMGNLLWSLALAVSYLLVLLAAPVAGSIMDATRSRKRFLLVSWLLTVFTTAMLYWVEPGLVALGMVLIVISNFGYAIGESFIASFLPDLAPPDRLGWISGLGWALGYLGGLVATAFALGLLGDVSADNFERIRWVGPFAAAFFLVSALPTFLFLHERGPRRRVERRLQLSLGFRRVARSLRTLRNRPGLRDLFLSVFFVMAGIYIVIAFTFIYGSQVIRWDESTRVTMFIITQMTAAAGALGFGWLQDRVGPVRVYRFTLLLWTIAVLAIFLTPRLAEWLTAVLDRTVEPQHVFLYVGAIAGLCLGSAQSAGRALVALMVPREEAGRWFGFWGLAAKAAAIFGLIGIGLLQLWLGLANAILFCMLLFLAALVATLRVRLPHSSA
ncbi:major facilitator superfamily MFS_1 [Thioalkalivibrio nitratireducens DSM 14787]|uniref:Major facilitator superfamily MFS_1 n=2 Tax=Thioalkalivibrio nitratireducens TaxID=186931 RepID=L0DVM5_THIND|nr:major facilitator superfamily MFS_1 [Thioalkalivibrio nitratireducens DSM 14787]